MLRTFKGRFSGEQNDDQADESSKPDQDKDKTSNDSYSGNDLHTVEETAAANDRTYTAGRPFDFQYSATVVQVSVTPENNGAISTRRNALVIGL